MTSTGQTKDCNLPMVPGVTGTPLCTQIKIWIVLDRTLHETSRCSGLNLRYRLSLEMAQSLELVMVWYEWIYFFRWRLQPATDRYDVAKEMCCNIWIFIKLTMPSFRKYAQYLYLLKCVISCLTHFNGLSCVFTFVYCLNGLLLCFVLGGFKCFFFYLSFNFVLFCFSFFFISLFIAFTYITWSF